MLDPAVVERIRELIAAELEPREGVLRDNCRAASNRLASRGLAISGNSAREYGSLAIDELKVRADIIWSSIRRAHGSLGGEYAATTLKDLQQQLTEHIHAQSTKVRAQVKVLLQRHPARATESIDGDIRNAVDGLLRRMNVEAKFYCDQLQRPAAAAGAASITIHGNVGAVQTGAFAIANVSFAGHDGERLLTALEALREGLERNTEATAEQRAQGGELVGDLIVAVQAERPNVPKVAGLLSGLATSVQTVASLRGALELVRDAARAIGLL